MAVQPTFPQFVLGSARHALLQWARAWLRMTYPGQTRYNRAQLRQAMFQALPPHLMPVWQQALWAWWVRRFHDIARGLGLVFVGGSAGADLVDQMTLPFAEFLSYQVERARAAKIDLDAIERDIQSYSDLHQLGLNIPQVMQRVRQAAGL